MEPTIDALDGWQGIFYWPEGLFLLGFLVWGCKFCFLYKNILFSKLVDDFVGAILYRPFCNREYVYLGNMGIDAVLYII